MDPLDSISQLSRLLRSQVSADKEYKRSNTEGPSRQAKPVRMSLAELEHDIKLKLKRVNHDSGRMEKQARTLVESVLVWEYGERVHNEPKFNLLIAKINQQLNHDEKAREAIGRLITQLVTD